MLLFSGNVFAKTVKKTMCVEQSIVLTAPKKAKWKSSNSRVVKIAKGGKRQSVTVKAKKKGSARVTAKVGRKKYIWKITVKKQKTALPTESVVRVVSDGNNSVYSVASSGVSVVGYFDNSFADLIINGINSHRLRHKKAVLTKSSALCQSAAVRACEASVLQSHVRPNGLAYLTVSGTKSKNYRDSRVRGENIAWGCYTGNDVVEAWIGSLKHNENLLRGFGTIGVSVFYARQSDGNYIPFVVAHFGF